MGASIGRRVVLGYVIALATLLVVGGVSYNNLHELNQQRQSVLSTIEVLQRSESLFARVADVSSLSRGFALSGSDQLAETFQIVSDEVDREFQRLVAVTVANPAQQQRLTELRPLLEDRLRISRALMDMRRSSAPNRAESMAATVVEGSQVMERIRTLLHNVSSEEQRLLQARQATANYAEKQTMNALLYGTALAVVFVVFASYFVTRSIRVPLKVLMQGAAQFGAGDYAHRVAITAKDEVGQLANVFNDMAQQVAERQSALATQDWLNATLGRFSSIFEAQRVLGPLCRSVLQELAQCVNAKHSVIYTPQGVNGSVALHLRASYACEHPPAKVAPGQGLVGQCYHDKKLMTLSNVPAEYIKIQSALGAAPPTNIMLVPAVFDGEVKAVIELASFEPFTELHSELLRRMSDSLGVVLNSITSAMRTEELLLQAQQLSETLNQRNQELQVQSEQLQQSERLLMEQQAELKQANEELEQGNEELQQANAEMEEKTTLLEEQKRAVEIAGHELSAARLALEEKVRQLDQTSKYKSEFLANMSHELRTPLNSLLILSNVLASNVEGNLTHKQLERLKAINASGNDLLELINDILDLSKIEAGAMDLVVAELPISDLTQFVDSTFRHMVESKGLSFDIEVAPNTPSVIATDIRRVQQILKNLLANACKFTQRGSIKLSIAPATSGWEDTHQGLDGRHGVVAFAVSDTGIGIAKERQQVIFEAFQQGDAGTARRYGGTGLGLSISRELTRLLGAALTLKSEEGVGSVFTLYLPVKIEVLANVESSPEDLVRRLQDHFAAQAAAQSKLAAARALRSAGSTDRVESPGELVLDDRNELQSGDHVLLIVEDDKAFARVIADFAREKGFKILFAHTGAAAIDLARRFRPTAITLDLLLPDNDGWVVLDRLKHDPETRHIPLHVISVANHRERSLKQGAVSHLLKPVTQESIEQALDQTLELVGRPVKQLLVIEDDERQRQSIVDLIGNGDVKVSTAPTAKEALRAIETLRFDCIVVDLGLPDMSGIELIKAIQSRLAESAPPIVVYTGRSLTREEETQLRRVAEAIIVKDVNSPERLLAETALFLHRVQSNLPEAKRRLIELVHKEDPVLSKRKVLVVDDDVRNIFAITAALETHSMRVLYAESGRAGIEVLQRNQDVDIVLMDVMMPEMDGYEAIRLIRQDARFKHLPIIAVTAKAMRGDRERCLKVGASDYITKPVDVDQLRSLLRVWLYK